MNDQTTGALRLYNTLTRSKQVFEPIDAANVRMYVCGPTVYDDAHIGNARPVIVFDVLFRLLRHLYGAEHVTYVRNITDVDDKINARALERAGTGGPILDEIRTLTASTAQRYIDDTLALGCLPPTQQPRATEYVSDPGKRLDMVRLIEGLITRGHAYEAQGHVLFAVASLPGYGQLSRRSQDEMIAGARVEVAPYKRAPGDFVLWKPSDPATEPGWESPWGFGRPGWHIECSAMSGALLGESFDIHAGGIDLIFPHHENEIAQTCGYTGRPVMANVWMHNGFLQVEGQKMSKSLGNFVTIRDLLETDRFGGRSWEGPVLRLAMLKTHYRQPIDWTVRALEEALANLERWRTATRLVPAAGQLPVPEELLEVLSDDLATPQAVTLLHRWAGEDEAEKLAASADFLGLMREAWNERGQRRTGTAAERSDRVQGLIDTRIAARRAKNFAEADRIRDELAAMGIELMDGKDPATGEPTTTWRVKA